jgi:hypothetical protein
MLDIIGKLGIPGGIGFLIGIAVVTWVRPTTGPGTVLLVVIPIVFCLTIAGIIAKLRGSKPISEERSRLP